MQVIYETTYKNDRLVLNQPVVFDILFYYLNKNNGNINSTAYECLLLKAEDDSIALPGGLTLANNSAYWLRLAKKYKPNGSRIL